MKIYISADMEGIAGVNHWNEVTRSHLDYPVHRRQMGAEVAAACQGCLEAGATEIWVKDAHSTGRNLLPEDLPAGTQLIRGWSGHPASMVQELDESFDALLFIGYHSWAGSGGNPLAHTMSSAKLERLWINERESSEFLLFSYWAATMQIPVALVTGDKALTEEVEYINPHIATVAVKTGIGDSTVNMHPEKAQEKIKRTALSALSGGLEHGVVNLPEEFEVRLRFLHARDAYRASFYPGCELVDGKTVMFQTTVYFEVLRTIKFIL